MSLTPCRSIMLLLAMTAMSGRGVWAQQSIVDTVHNLSSGGPGSVVAATEEQVCIFCHAPHGTSGVQPLWNRNPVAGGFTIYQSSTLDAAPGQPTGSSKLCLSCHDGTIALGEVVSRSTPISMVGSQTMPSGPTNLGTDLSDDHPISFQYTSGLAATDTELADPSTLPPNVRLDSSGMIQCTTCHNPHHNPLGKFLVASNEFAQLCVTCHQKSGWSLASHQSSSASVLGGPISWPYPTVAQNGCASCHTPHGAGGHERLLRDATEEENCLVCHNGSVATFDIASLLNKNSSHDVRLFSGIHDPTEPASAPTTHVECTDCHNPHAAQAPVFGGGYVPIGLALTKVRGVTTGGIPVAEAQFEYEVCFRCHGDSPVSIPGRITRLSDQPNLRLRFSMANPSFHPVVTSSVNPNVPSLVPGLAPGSMIRCTDCHNNDTTRRTGGTGPDGPHGSIHDFLLERNYTTTDPNPESAFAYAMCYKCHRRDSILNDESFPEHDEHVRNEDTPCTACHDPHGVSTTVPTGSQHTHLINFDLSIVSPSPVDGRLEFVDLGVFSGQCTLLCHGEDHRDRTY